MAANAEKFVIALQAQYAGSEDIRRLQGDLDRLSQVENLQKLQARITDSATAMKQAAGEAARLKVAMESSYNERILGRLEKADASLRRLQSSYTRQGEMLATYRERMDTARAALESFSVGLSQTPTDGEAKKLRELGAALEAAAGQYQRQSEVLDRTGSSIKQTSYRVQELRESLRQSVDPSIRSEYERQVGIQDRHAKAVASLRQELASAGRALQEQGISTKNLAGEQQRLAAATETSGQQLAAMRRLGIQSFAGIETEVQKLKRAWADLDKSNMSMRERFAHWGRYREQIAQAREQTNGWTDQVHKLQRGWAGVVGVIGGLSLAKLGLDQFVQFDDAMLKVQALSKSTGDEFAMLKQQAMDLGATTRFTATEAAQGMSELAATGMSAREIYETLPAAMDMAAISGMGVKDSADKVTDIMSQFGLEADKATHVVDVLTQGYTGASTSMEELGQAMVYVGPLANTVGYSLEETTAILQALAESGYKGEKAGTALRGGLARLLKPSGAASEVLQKYNIQVLDSSGKMRNFADILDDLGKSSMSSAEMITLFGQEAGPGMMALLNQGAGALRGFEEKLQNVDGKGRETADALEKGIGGSMRKLGSSVQAIAIAFGNTFAPAVRLVADGLSSLASWIAGLSEPVKTMIGWVGGAITAFAMWKLGLGLMAGALARFGLDLASKGLAVWNFATRTMPAYIHAMRLAEGGTLTFRGALNNAAGSVPVLGNLLTSSAKDLFTFSGAATKAGAALRLVSAAGMLLAAWEFGKMIGGWLNGFDFVQKAAVKTMEFFHILGLRAQWAWAWLSGGDTDAVSQKIETAKQIYAEMYADIGKSAEKPVETNAAAQEAITRKTAEEAARQLQIVQESIAGQRDAYDSLDDEGGEDAEPGSKKQKDQEKPVWQAWLDQKYAELDKAKEEKTERARVYGPDGKWSYHYGDKSGLQEKDGKLYRKDSAAAQPASTRIVKQDNGWAQLFENGKFVKAMSIAAADKLVRDRQQQGYEQVGGKIAAATPDGVQRKRDVDDGRVAPSKVVELRLGKSRLTGSESDAEDFIDQLVRAGMLA